MTPFRGTVGICALLVVAAGTNPLQAGWCNVFQVCCHSNSPPATSYYAGPDPCAPACPQPVCTTRWVARCYYQPVVTYQTRTYYEPVTTYRTSYYWESVTTNRYSMYYDPCTCSYQQVVCPTTSLRLRSQCCPVQSWVARCCTVPVTTQQQMMYYEPVTTCSTPTVAAAPPCPENPGILERPSAPSAPGVRENPSSSFYPAPDKMQRLDGNSNYRQFQPRTPGNETPPPPVVKLERIVAAPAGPRVDGQVVRSDKAPHANARVLFVSADRQGTQETAQADSTGRFRVTLASGQWLAYVYGPDGKLAAGRKIDVNQEVPAFVTLLSQ